MKTISYIIIGLAGAYIVFLATAWLAILIILGDFEVIAPALKLGAIATYIFVVSCIWRARL